jgi:hypothetical protein
MTENGPNIGNASSTQQQQQETMKMQGDEFENHHLLYQLI